MERTFNSVTIELTKGDITRQPDVQAIVNAANAQLRIGGGVAGAIHGKGDPELERLTRPKAPIKPGEAVITEAPNLPNDYVIHCLGPVYGRDKPADQFLADCYKNALRLADENNISTIAFPAISTGAFGFPMEDAAKIAINTVIESAEQLKNVEMVRFVLFGDTAYKVHEEILRSITPEES